MLNELLILTKIKAGDIKAFEELFRCYYSPLCWYAASITGRMEVAEEIVEELFYVLWKDREQLQIFQSVKNYLYRATRNQSIQYCEHEEVKERYRESVLTASSSEQVTDPHQQMEYEELQKLINNTLEKLPERRMQIFKMHRTEGKKYAEIAVQLSLSVIPSHIYKYRNLYLLSIDYAFRPRLRSRLTQSGRTFLWKPWVFGAWDSHPRSATHTGILSS